jgi:two-component system, LytTR family, sensor kinase
MALVLRPTVTSLRPADKHDSSSGSRIKFISTAHRRSPMRKRSWIWILLGWFFLIRFSEYYSLQTDLGHGLNWTASLRYTLIELGFWTAMTPVIGWLAEKFSLDRPKVSRNISILFLSNFLVALLHSYYRVVLNHVVYPGLPIHSVWRLGQAYLVTNSFVIAWFFWAVIGIHHAIESSSRAHEREKELIKAQLELLKGQLQPHFLFNTLNSISWLMREDVETADNVIASLGELLRTTLSVPATEEVTLREELKILELYLTIERARFQDRLRILIDADPQTLDCSVPCLLLQPIVENAVRHGVGRLDGPGLVEIRAMRLDTELSLTILDNGPGLRSERTLKEGIGLANTRARLEKHYGEFQSFHYGNRDQGGLIVEIRIPLRVHRVADRVNGSGLHEASHVNR